MLVEIMIVFMEKQATQSKIGKLVLLRHGESLWNHENRFTGWVDIDLSDKGRAEALDAGRALKSCGVEFQICYTSFLKRAIKTLHIALEEMDRMWLPTFKDWRLNERHYGELQGLNKSETAKKHGEDQVKVWRRSFDVPPPLMDKSHPDHPSKQLRYASVPINLLPSGESLKDTIQRFTPLWNDHISRDLREGKNILISAHGNSLRAIIKILEKVSDEAIMEVNMPTGIPLLYDLQGSGLQVISKQFLGSEEKVKAAMESVAAQGKAK